MPKQDLAFNKPLMNAAGTLGFAQDPRAPIEWNAFGAFVTNPVSMRPRLAAAQPSIIQYSGGFLLHTGLPNPGFRRVLQEHVRGWARSHLPVIVHLMADRPDETRDMVRALEGRENIVAAELGFAPLLADDLIHLAVEMSTGELPLIVNLPSDQFLRLGPGLLQLGAAALSLGTPRGSLSLEGSFVSGRLHGPGLYPTALDLVQTAARIGIPVIGAGGVFSSDSTTSMLAAGALAVQLDAVLWLPGANKKSLVD
jgi:dihydroorotate dehydrogenase (NAD+) catalytic subunit